MQTKANLLLLLAAAIWGFAFVAQRVGMEYLEPFTFNGNVANKGQVTNLPANACVEIPVWVSKKGFEAVHVGSLPAQCAALTSLSSQIEEMAVEGTLSGDPRMIFQAIAFDPLTSAVLSLAEIKQMVNEMLAKNQDYLPTFKHFTV